MSRVMHSKYVAEVRWKHTSQAVSCEEEMERAPCSSAREIIRTAQSRQISSSELQSSFKPEKAPDSDSRLS